MGLDCIPLCRVLRLYPPPLCHPILARVSWRPHKELQNRHNPRDVLTILEKQYNNGQPMVKMPAVCLAHMEEESHKKDEVVDSEDSDGIEGVMEEFMVHLARAVKDAQKEERCCYHCSSLDHFICDCPLVKASRTNPQLNHKEGTEPKKGAWSPQMKVTMPTVLSEGVPKA